MVSASTLKAISREPLSHFLCAAGSFQGNPRRHSKLLTGAGPLVFAKVALVVVLHGGVMAAKSALRALLSHSAWRARHPQQEQLRYGTGATEIRSRCQLLRPGVA